MVLEQLSARPELRGAAQPSLDGYSRLLQDVVEMTEGRDQLPHLDVTDNYPVGTAQPAWMAIFRSGPVRVFTDHAGHVRAFVCGQDPRKAYFEHYGVLRHCLAGLVEDDGSDLQVEVYAFQNDFSRCELRLNRTPYVFAAHSFPIQEGRTPLDLQGLKTFFEAGGKLTGAHIDQEQGLVLFAEEGDKQTVAGERVSLADFAVAYRAVFHAGDNEAFVSLDPHQDATKVTVNFGGYLEHTRVGQVVLDADKRFKTITSGLDPDSLQDIRDYTTRFVPSFLTSTERELIGEFRPEEGWAGTRFWYYPDSVEIESDLGYQYARVANPQFTADAERSRDDFPTPEAFERFKQTALSPAIRDNIRHLNEHYTEYAAAFPELKELSTVARLMGICCWLRRAKARKRLDLDALLSVELPAHETSTERTQLVVTTGFTAAGNTNATAEMVRDSIGIRPLGADLERNVAEAFINVEQLARFLSRTAGRTPEDWRLFVGRARELIEEAGNKKVKTLISNKSDLEAFAETAGEAADFPFSEPFRTLEAQIQERQKKLDELKSRIETSRRRIERGNSTAASVAAHNRLVDDYNQEAEKANAAVRRLEAIELRTRMVCEIGGGIDLGPDQFNIRPVAESPQLDAFRDAARLAGTEWTRVGQRRRWLRSASESGVGEFRNELPKSTWESTGRFSEGDFTQERLGGRRGQLVWAQREGGAGTWRDLVKQDDGTWRERYFDGRAQELKVATYKAGEFTSCTVAELVKPDKIVFGKMDPKGLAAPKDPPVWWRATAVNEK
ncbi:MAG: hypothetical protein R6X33_03280 [Candidatus Brocadiia bacterium]